MASKIVQPRCQNVQCPPCEYAIMMLHQPAHAMASLTATAIVRLTSPLAKSNIASRDLVKFLVIFFRVSNATSYYPQNVVSFSYELKMIIITLDIFRYWLQQHFLWSFLTKKKKIAGEKIDI